MAYGRRQQVFSVLVVFDTAGNVLDMFFFDAHEDVGVRDEIVAVPRGTTIFGHFFLCRGLIMFELDLIGFHLLKVTKYENCIQEKDPTCFH